MFRIILLVLAICLGAATYINITTPEPVKPVPVVHPAPVKPAPVVAPPDCNLIQIPYLTDVCMIPPPTYTPPAVKKATVYKKVTHAVKKVRRLVKHKIHAFKHRHDTKLGLVCVASTWKGFVESSCKGKKVVATCLRKANGKTRCTTSISDNSSVHFKIKFNDGRVHKFSPSNHYKLRSGGYIHSDGGDR